MFSACVEATIANFLSSAPAAMTAFDVDTARVADVRLEGEPETWLVTGSYPAAAAGGQARPWQGYVEARCRAEAGFRGAMEMAGEQLPSGHSFSDRMKEARKMTIATAVVSPRPEVGIDRDEMPCPS